MSAERITLQLWNPQQARPLLTDAWASVKSLLMAGHRLQVEIKPQKRSMAANARLHAMLADIARQVQWAGAYRDVECWKRLLVAAWLRARGEPLQMLPAIDGHGVDIVFRRTSEMTGAEVSELMQYVEAWGAEQGVQFTGPEQ